MVGAAPSFTVAIEEEYLLVDHDGHDVVNDQPREIFDKCKAIAGDKLVDVEAIGVNYTDCVHVCAGMLQRSNRSDFLLRRDSKWRVMFTF
jgi:hypothetical protein